MVASQAKNFDARAALSELESRIAQANPKSEQVHQQACAAMPGGNTRTVLHYPPFPLALSGGEGCSVTDVDGHRYIDYQVEQTAGLYGHSEPRIQQAIRDALDGGITLGGPTARENELSALFQARFPAVDLVRFTNSGTEANLLALSTARVVTGREKLVAFKGCYHGSVASFGAYGQGLNMPFDWLMCEYNDIESTRQMLLDNADQIAAVILEPMTGSGGCIPAKPEFVQMLREETERAGALLLFDEVMTSRLGPGGLHGRWDVKPDLVSFGKYLGGGLTFGAFGGAESIMSRFDPRRSDSLAHAGTFNNNILTLSAAVVGLRDVYTPQAALELNAAGDTLRERLNQELEARSIVGKVTGIGSMMMLHLSDGPLDGPQDANAIDPDLRGIVHLGLLERGIYVARRNMFVLSLPMTESEHDQFVDAFGDVLDEHREVLTRRN